MVPPQVWFFVSLGHHSRGGGVVARVSRTEAGMAQDNMESKLRLLEQTQKIPPTPGALLAELAHLMGRALHPDEAAVALEMGPQMKHDEASTPLLAPVARAGLQQRVAMVCLSVADTCFGQMQADEVVADCVAQAVGAGVPTGQVCRAVDAPGDSMALQIVILPADGAFRAFPDRWPATVSGAPQPHLYLSFLTQSSFCPTPRLQSFLLVRGERSTRLPSQETLGAMRQCLTVLLHRFAFVVGMLDSPLVCWSEAGGPTPPPSSAAVREEVGAASVAAVQLYVETYRSPVTGSKVLAKLC